MIALSNDTWEILIDRGVEEIVEEIFAETDEHFKDFLRKETDMAMSGTWSVSYWQEIVTYCSNKEADKCNVEQKNTFY